MANANRSSRRSSASQLRGRRYLSWTACAAVLTFAVIWAYVAAMPMAFLGRDYPLWVAKEAIMDRCDLGQVAVFGDSRAVAAIMPDELGVSVSNLALSTTTPIETYFAVQRALRCPHLPAQIVIAHSPASFTHDPDFWDEAPLLRILDTSQLQDIAENATRLDPAGTVIPGLNKGLATRAREAMFALHFPTLYFPSLVQGFIALRWWHNVAALHRTEESRGQAFFGTADGSNEVAEEGQMTSFAPPKLIDFYFSRTLAMLQARGVQTLFVPVPLNSATCHAQADAARTQFLLYLRQKSHRFPLFHLVQPPTLCWQDTLFGDRAHVNEAGAKAYTAQFATWLKEMQPNNGKISLGSLH